MNANNKLAVLYLLATLANATPKAAATVLDVYGDWSATLALPEGDRQAEFDRLSREEYPIDAVAETVTLESGLRPSNALAWRILGPASEPYYPVDQTNETFSRPAVAIGPNYLMTAAHVVSDSDIGGVVYDSSTGLAAFTIVDLREDDLFTQDLAVIRVEPIEGTALSAIPEWATLPVHETTSGSQHYQDFDGSLAALAGMGPQRRRFIDQQSKVPVGNSWHTLPERSSQNPDAYSYGLGRLTWGVNVVNDDPLPYSDSSNTGVSTEEVKIVRDNPSSPSYLSNTAGRAYYDPSRATPAFEAGLQQGDSGSGFLRREELGWSVLGALSFGQAESNPEPGYAGRTFPLSGANLSESATLAWIDQQVEAMGGVDLNGDGMLGGAELTARLADLPTTQVDNDWGDDGAAGWAYWNTPNNWSSGATPTSGADVVRIDGTPSVTQVQIIGVDVTQRSLVVGGSSSAHLAQFLGSSVSLTDVLMIGHQEGSVGVYSQAVGNLSSATAYIGYHGLGTFEHTDGKHQVRDTIYVGRASGTDTSEGGCGMSTNCYTLNQEVGKVADVFARRIVVGALGKGRFEHVAGLARAMRVTIGHGVDSEGVYHQTGGELQVSERLEVGLDGKGSLILDGATVNVDYLISVGASSSPISENSLRFENNDSTVSLTGGKEYDSSLEIDPSAAIAGADQHLSLVIDFAQDGPDLTTTSAYEVLVDFGRDLVVKELTLGNVATAATGKLNLSLAYDVFVGGPAAPDSLTMLAGIDGTITGPGNLYFYTTNLTDNGILTGNDGYVQLIPGDADLNGEVGPEDFTKVAENWLVESGASWMMGDFDGDGAVNSADYAILAGNWLAGPIEGIAPTNGGAPVPEPSGLMLCGFLIALGRIFRRTTLAS